MSDHRPDATALETLQSLIVAFVLAMIFRGFVIEGFVIPTGSMAPTLMGLHLDLHSDATGFEFAAGVERPMSREEIVTLFRDPMVGPKRGAIGVPAKPRPRSGDRILVLKSLYPFMQPKRFDVVVFKNPTNPFGDAGNYIKRLIGLPNETVWLADGDVFVREPGDPTFTVRRKPEHVQRAVWQPVSNSDYYVLDDMKLTTDPGRPWEGEQWSTEGRTYSTESAAPTELHWKWDVREINDWTPYNILRTNAVFRPVSDIRIAAGVAAGDEAFTTDLTLHTRGHEFIFSLDRENARVGYRAGSGGEWIATKSTAVDLPDPGRVFELEFWHADQALRIFIDGEEIVSLEYEWSAEERIRNAFGGAPGTDVASLIDWTNNSPDAERPEIAWRFAGSEVALHCVRLDRDLHYRADSLNSPQNANPSASAFEDLVRWGTPAFGTHPDKLAVLGRNHFMMAGDNSHASSDSRLWGSPAPEIAAQIDPAPFVVHRKLLMGKAWAVYFPAPLAITEKGPPVIPNFGELRFIR